MAEGRSLKFNLLSEECCCLRYDAIWSSRSSPLFRRNMLSPSWRAKNNPSKQQAALNLLSAYCFFTLKMEAVFFFKMLVIIYQITWCHIQEYGIRYSHHCENLNSTTYCFFGTVIEAVLICTYSILYICSCWYGLLHNF